ncbi:MAG: glycosyltransferase [Candidatus Paceibacterota bacterium]
MKILMISSDKHICRSDSPVRQRMIDYSHLVEELHLIVIGTGKQLPPEVVANRLFIYPIFSFFRLIALAKALVSTGYHWSAKDIDLVTAQDPFELGLLGLYWSKKLDAKLQLQIHTDLMARNFRRQSLKNRLRFILAQYLLPKADCLRVVSERIKKSLADFKLSGPIQVLPIQTSPLELPADDSQITERSPGGRKVFLTVSRLEKEKRPALLLEAFVLIREKIPAAELIIVGDGTLRLKLVKQAQISGVAEAVRFVGWRDDVSSYYRLADCFLLTSAFEGYGLVLAEAAAVGLPIVSTDVGIAREVGAKIVQPEAVDIAAAACQVIDQPALFKSKSLAMSQAEYFRRLKDGWGDCLKK